MGGCPAAGAKGRACTGRVGAGTAGGSTCDTVAAKLMGTAAFGVGGTEAAIGLRGVDGGEAKGAGCEENAGVLAALDDSLRPAAGLVDDALEGVCAPSEGLARGSTGTPFDSSCEDDRGSADDIAVDPLSPLVELSLDLPAPPLLDALGSSVADRARTAGQVPAMNGLLGVVPAEGVVGPVGCPADAYSSLEAAASAASALALCGVMTFMLPRSPC